MVRLGWISDPHINVQGDSGSSGAVAEMPTDISYLMGTKGSEDLIFGGDQISFNRGAEAPMPHTTPDHVQRFWSLVEDSGYSDSVAAAIPGNHDMPVNQWVAESEKLGYGEQVRVPIEINYDGVTALCINTNGQGGNGGGGMGAGFNVGYVRFAERRWLQQKLAEAHSRGDIVLVFAHHLTKPITNDSALNGHSPNGELQENDNYWVALNFNDLVSDFESESPVVVFHGHDYQFDSAGYEEQNGAYYVYKRHYWNSSTDTATTVSYIDADPSTGDVTCTTVDQSRTESTILNVTPSW